MDDRASGLWREHVSQIFLEPACRVAMSAGSVWHVILSAAKDLSLGTRDLVPQAEILQLLARQRRVLRRFATAHTRNRYGGSFLASFAQDDTWTGT